jgi:hypothetical protein
MVVNNGLNNVKIDYTGATASDINNNGYSAEPPSAAIDNNLTAKWVVGFVSNNLPALIIDLKSNKLVNSYTYITGFDLADRDPKSWVFYGSNDNVNWVTLDTRTNMVITTSRNTQAQWFTF